MQKNREYSKNRETEDKLEYTQHANELTFLYSFNFVSKENEAVKEYFGGIIYFPVKGGHVLLCVVILCGKVNEIISNPCGKH